MAADAGSYVEGVAAGVRILPVKVLGDNGSGWSNWSAAGIVWAADHGADVINMSLGGSSSDPVRVQAIAYARSKGVTVIAAAGNASTSTPQYPAADPGVISVAATDRGGSQAWFSNYGSSIDIAAPGVDILSTFMEVEDWGYVWMNGTSMASPHVAGVAALVKAAAPALTPDQVEWALTRSATDRGAVGRDVLFGYGEVDAARAVGAAKTLAGPANRAPVAAADAYSLPYDPGTRTLAVAANDTDADGDALIVLSATHGTSGKVATAGGALTYTPTRSGPFVDTVTYTVSDGRGGTAVGRVSISVAAAPKPVVRKPSAPRIGSPIALPGSVRLSWSPPADTGGAAISGYRITAYRGTSPLEDRCCQRRHDPPRR